MNARAVRNSGSVRLTMMILMIYLGIDWSGVIAATCGALGFNISPIGDMARRTDRPILWQLRHKPETEHCRQNDYWLERGTKKLRLYMAADDEWVRSYETINELPAKE